MARVFRKKNKDLIKLDVVSADKVWEVKSGKKPKLRKDVDIYGKVSKGFSVAVVTTNMNGENHKFVEDFVTLPKKTKQAVSDMFMNKGKKVAYLVRGDDKKREVKK